MRDALHLLKLQVELLQLAIEQLGIVGEIHRGLSDSVIVQTPRGQGILGLELDGLVISVVEGVVEVLDLIDRVLNAHQLLTLI